MVHQFLTLQHAEIEQRFAELNPLYVLLGIYEYKDTSLRVPELVYLPTPSIIFSMAGAGCFETYNQLGMQRPKLPGTDRLPKITDVREFCEELVNNLEIYTCFSQQVQRNWETDELREVLSVIMSYYDTDLEKEECIKSVNLLLTRLFSCYC